MNIYIPTICYIICTLSIRVKIYMYILFLFFNLRISEENSRCLAIFSYFSLVKWTTCHRHVIQFFVYAGRRRRCRLSNGYRLNIKRINKRKWRRKPLSCWTAQIRLPRNKTQQPKEKFVYMKKVLVWATH